MPSIDLVVNPCRSLCAWRQSRAGAELPGRPGGKLFVCAGCGSQWEPGQAWTPRNADGRVPKAVRTARRT